MILLAFAILLVLVCSYAFARGGQPERLMAGLFVLGLLSTVLISAWTPPRPREFQLGIFIVDATMLFAMVPIMLKANRLWPIAVMAMQLLAVIGHLIKLLDPNVVTVLYWIVNVFWSIPQTLLLGLGVHRHVHRERRFGVERSWSNTSDRSRAAEPERPPTN